MSAYKIKIGQFREDQYGVLQGTISGLGLGAIEVVSQETRDREGNPYLKLIGDPSATAFEIGAAFPKQKDGISYYSVILDSPILKAPLSAALFPDRDGDEVFNLIWQRQEAPKPLLDKVASSKPGQERRLVKSSTAPKV